MSSSILPEADTPFSSLGGFKWGVVSNTPPTKGASVDPQQETLKEPDLNVLGLLENKVFKGKGYNSIFRPRSEKPLDPEHRIAGGFGDDLGDNDLQLNLTVETLKFDRAIGQVPNRGLLRNEDILLGGIPYTDAVEDVTNEATGKGDSPTRTGIHFEPGIWMAIPGSKATNGKATLCRMASIPHGTTINMQGLQPSLTPVAGPPSFDPVDIVPFFIGRPESPFRRVNNLTFEFPEPGSKDLNGNIIGAVNAKGINRKPQNLHKFNGESCA